MPVQFNRRAPLSRENHSRAYTERRRATSPALVAAGWGCQKHALHLSAMFIHYVFITGCADRGAWPWRKPIAMTV